MATYDGILYKNIPLMGVTGGDTYTNCTFQNVGLTGSVTLGPGCQLKNVSGTLESVVLTGDTCKVDNTILTTLEAAINGAFMTQTRVVAKEGAVGTPSLLSAGGAGAGGAGAGDPKLSSSMYRMGQLSVEGEPGKPVVIGYPQGVVLPQYLGYGQEAAIGLTGRGAFRAGSLTVSLGDTGKLRSGASGTLHYVAEGGVVSVTCSYKGTTGALNGTVETRTVASLSLMDPGGFFSGWLPPGHTGILRTTYRGTPPVSMLSLGYTGGGMSLLGQGATGKTTVGGESLSYIDRYVRAGYTGGYGVTAYGGVSGAGLSYLSFGITGAHPKHAAFLITTSSTKVSVTIQGLVSSSSYCTVIWGDGYVTTGTAGSSFSHTYAKAGSYCLATDCRYNAASTPLFPDGNTYLKKVLQFGNMVFTSSSGNRMFYNSKGLTEVVSWPSWTSAMVNSAYMFYGCSSLAAIPDKWSGMAYVSDATSMFQGCSSLTSIPASWEGLEGLVTCLDMFKSSSLTSIPERWAGLAKVSTTRGMFSGCSLLSSIPTSWVGIGPSTLKVASWMFEQCISLSAIPSSWEGLGSLTSSGDMFNNCRALSAIPDSWAGLSSLTSAVGMFNGCTSLAAFPSSWAGLEKMVEMHYMFAGCPSIATGGTESIASLSAVTNCYAFMDGCTKFTGDVYSMYSRLSIKCTSTSYYRYAFRNCTLAANYSSLPYYWKY